ncbi:MAG: hypothetical protein H0A76_00130 [Candidatus Thiodubiliella endoseptemdiera]|uniref:Uncharacterized protein n=1 Tax=Candidatus Thiodubiliella endoseptemdiera TaxID=2738886 RepID=A0A853EY50_9GAMM|nr:hypothetical protein [Candidatus Thiodubiliella endoseptemdiera]
MKEKEKKEKYFYFSLLVLVVIYYAFSIRFSDFLIYIPVEYIWHTSSNIYNNDLKELWEYLSTLPIFAQVFIGIISVPLSIIVIVLLLFIALFTYALLPFTLGGALLVDSVMFLLNEDFAQSVFAIIALITMGLYMRMTDW